MKKTIFHHLIHTFDHLNYFFDNYRKNLFFLAASWTIGNAILLNCFAVATKAELMYRKKYFYLTVRYDPITLQATITNICRRSAKCRASNLISGNDAQNLKSLLPHTTCFICFLFCEWNLSYAENNKVFFFPSRNYSKKKNYKNILFVLNYFKSKLYILTLSQTVAFIAEIIFIVVFIMQKSHHH